MFFNQLKNLLSLDIQKINLINKSKFDLIAGDFGKSIILVGAGELGKYALKGLLKIGIKPLAFTDNNKKLWGTKIDKIKVMSPQEAADNFKDNAVFVITVYNGSSLIQQMRNLQCKFISPFTYLFLKYSEVFLPYFSLDFPDIIFSESDEIKKALNLWADNYSKAEYIAQFQWRILRDFCAAGNKLPMNELYFPKDLWTSNSKEIFIDCGAFRGDTIKNFIVNYDSAFSKIIAIEPDPENYQYLNNYVSTLPENINNKIFTYQTAVGEKSGEISFDISGTVASAINSSSDIKIKCSTLDALCEGFEPTFVKMDVEGAELDILKGAQKIISKARTIWAVCLYHRQTDLWRIPLYFNKLSDEYFFYLRRYAEESWELIMYAVPKNRAQ
ncbi:MAG: FkbM family methyltransferase [Smithella sp.]